MNSRVSWSVEGIDPSVRERAEAAARRAGMSLERLAQFHRRRIPAHPIFARTATPGSLRASQETRDVADIHQRLDSITRQIEQISKPLPRAMHADDAPRGEQGVARQLNDAISRLDARLSQISNPAPRKPPSFRTSSARPTWSSARPPRSIAPRRRSPRLARFRDRRNRRAPERTRQYRARAAADAAAQRAADRASNGADDGAALCPRARIFPRSSAICSRSPARSRRCSVPT